MGKDKGFCAGVKHFFPIFAATKNHKPVKNVMRTISIRIVFILLILPSVLFAQYEPRKMRKNEIKVALLSLVSGTSKVTYERLVFDYQSIEITAGIIGLGVDILKGSDPKGTTWRAAYKFIFPSPYNINNQLCGFYVKPELCYSSYYYTNPDLKRLKVDRVALMGVVGYDWVKNWFVFDTYAGLGLAAGNCNGSNYHHGFIGWNDHSPYAFTAGFRIGIAF